MKAANSGSYVLIYGKLKSSGSAEFKFKISVPTKIYSIVHVNFKVNYYILMEDDFPLLKYEIECAFQ